MFGSINNKKTTDEIYVLKFQRNVNMDNKVNKFIMVFATPNPNSPTILNICIVQYINHIQHHHNAI
jgi:hypothetical protein